MPKKLIIFFTSLNVFIFRLSSGQIGSKLGKQSVLLLDTVGRKSGKKYSATLSYYQDGNNYLLVASNWGKEYQPAWFYNLMQQQQATIQVGARKIKVGAHQAKGEEYRRMWQLVTERNHQYIKYQKSIRRQIPIIILTPLD